MFFMRISVTLNACQTFILSIFMYLLCALRVHVNTLKTELIGLPS